MLTYPKPRGFDEYDRSAALTERGSGNFSLDYSLQGLFGETGGLLAEVKKHQRDEIAFEAHRRVVVEEIGDSLWYLASSARRAGIAMLDVVAQLPAERLLRHVPGEEVGFSDIDRTDLVSSFVADLPYTQELRVLGKAVGFLYSCLGDSTERWELIPHLAGVLNALIGVAHRSGITLEEVTAYNIEKALSRWPTENFKKFDVEFDDGFPIYERLPRQMRLEIVQHEAPAGGSFVLQRCNDLNLGDRLTDNITERDYYRFHDVFHYAFAAVLHWSPVSRSILKVKRKSKPEIDEAEDGARAAITEEGISTFIFNRAKELDFFSGVGEGELSYDLLKSVREFTHGFEVEACPPWLWERAILQGYGAFRFLLANKAALVDIDLDTRTLSFGPIPDVAG
jgi:NTP pyrophosphatase (non-canonical NTP hydrolase)